MSLTAEKDLKCPPYVHIQPKLAPAFDSNDLYKEWVTEWLDRNGFEKNRQAVETCGQRAVSLACSNGHQKRVRMTCHREYCPRCGKVDSLLHKRTKTRALDRLLWAPVLGYMVFTLPKEVSESLPSKATLSSLEKTAVKVVQANFSTPGAMARLHLVGEKSEGLHIHVNVLFPIIDTEGKGQVPQKSLDDIRIQWTEFVNKTFALNVEKTNVFYKFSTTERKKRHVIKYVTRPVIIAEKFLTLTDPAKHWYLSLKGWHNTRWYGQLANCKYKEFLKSRGIDITAEREKDIALAKNCPACGGTFRFIEILGIDEIAADQFRRIDENVWVDLEIFAVMKNKDSPGEEPARDLTIDHMPQKKLKARKCCDERSTHNSQNIYTQDVSHEKDVRRKTSNQHQLVFFKS